jgi:DNA-directed RNA polymerase subunit L
MLKERCDMAETRELGELSELTIKVDDTLKGLKALRGEVNKTLKALEKVREAKEREIINFVTNVIIQDAIDAEQFHKRISKEIEEHLKAFIERFADTRGRLSK